MHILVCDDDAAFSAKVAEYAATYFEAHEIPVQATVCSDPEQVLAIPDLELYRIAFLDVDMPQVNGIALGGQLRHRNPDICLVYVSAYLAFAWSIMNTLFDKIWDSATSSNGTSPSSCPAVWRTSMRP